MPPTVPIQITKPTTRFPKTDSLSIMLAGFGYLCAFHRQLSRLFSGRHYTKNHTFSTLPTHHTENHTC